MKKKILPLKVMTAILKNSDAGDWPYWCWFEPKLSALRTSRTLKIRTSNLPNLFVAIKIRFRNLEKTELEFELKRLGQSLDLFLLEGGQVYVDILVENFLESFWISNFLFKYWFEAFISLVRCVLGSTFQESLNWKKRRTCG